MEKTVDIKKTGITASLFRIGNKENVYKNKVNDPEIYRRAKTRIGS